MTQHYMSYEAEELETTHIEASHYQQPTSHDETSCWPVVQMILKIREIAEEMIRQLNS